MTPGGLRVCGVAAGAGGIVFGISMLTPLRGWLRPGVPLSIVGMGLGAFGLYHLTAQRDSRWARGGVMLGVSGLALGLIGMAGSAVHVGPPADAIINTGEHLGLVLVGAGMTSWSVPVIRHRLLGVFSAGPVLIALPGLAGIAMVSPDTFSRLSSGPLPLVFSLGWVLVGAGLAKHPATRRATPLSSG